MAELPTIPGYSCFQLLLGGSIFISYAGKCWQVLPDPVLPRFSKTFGHTWRLFTPPYTFHHRLYYVTRDKYSHAPLDTFEVLEKIARQKQSKAPFNQKEMVMDYLVNPNVAGITGLVWANKKKPVTVSPTAADSAYIRNAVAEMSDDNNYNFCVKSLLNYCKLILRRNGDLFTNKEVQLIIKEKQMRPFYFPRGQPFSEPEVLVYESPFYSLIQND